MLCISLGKSFRMEIVERGRNVSIAGETVIVGLCTPFKRVDAIREAGWRNLKH
jgi:hypothetical protein